MFLITHHYIDRYDKRTGKFSGTQYMGQTYERFKVPYNTQANFNWNYNTKEEPPNSSNNKPTYSKPLTYKEYYNRYLSKKAWFVRKMAANNAFDYYITFSDPARINAIFFETISWSLKFYPYDQLDIKIMTSDSLNTTEKVFFDWLHHDFLKH